MQSIHELVAMAARTAMVAEAMSQALVALKLIHHAGVMIGDEIDPVDFSCEIEKLKVALHAMGMEEEDCQR